jgi:O-antigen/teichoic acid export membrane protein
MGLSSAVMHLQDLTRKQFSSFYWMNVAMGLALTLIAGACSPLVASYYGQPELVGIISITCLMLFTESLFTLQRTIQQKNLNFKFMSVVEMLSATLMLVSNTLLAMNGFGVYSMVYSTLLASVFKALAYLYIGVFKEHNICLHFKMNDVKEPLKIGSYMVGSGILDFFSSEMDALVISSSFTMELFGVYSLCKTLAARIFQFVNPVVNNVLTPLMAKIQSEKDKMTFYYFKSIDLLGVINFLIYSIFALLSFSVLFILYGESYTQYAFLLFCLSYYYAFVSCNNPVGALTISTGRTDLGMYWTIFRIIFYVIYYYCISQFSLWLFAIGVAVIPMVTSYPFWRIVFSKVTTISFPSYFMVPLKPFLCCVPLMPIYFLDHWISNPLIGLVVLTPLVVGGYLIIIFTFRKELAMELFSTVGHDLLKIKK